MPQPDSCTKGRHGPIKRIEVERAYWEHQCQTCLKVLGYEYPGENKIRERTGAKKHT